MSDYFLDAALPAIGRGYTVFPITHKKPRTRFVNGDPAVSLASTPEQAQVMQERFPDATGAGIKLPADIGVFDADSHAAVRWCHRHLPRTFEVCTGRKTGGRHYYVVLTEPLRHNPRLKTLGLEFKTKGGYVVAPGSLHESGKRYTVHADVPLINIPEGIATLVGQPHPEGSTAEPSPAELRAWSNHVFPTPEARSMTLDYLADELAATERYCRTVLPEGDSWGNKFFGQGARLGMFVAKGVLDYDAAVEHLESLFDQLDTGKGTAAGEAHVKRSIRRGIATGARDVR